MMRVQQQDGIAHHRLPLLVRVRDKITGPPDPQAAGIAGLPSLLGHFLTGGLEPRNVQDAFTTNGPAQEELTALKHQLGALQLDDRAHERVKG